MEIRHATKMDIETIKNIYSLVRDYMKENGNPNQWDQGYPSEEIINQDIAAGNCYLLEEKGVIQGVFVFSRRQLNNIIVA